MYRTLHILLLLILCQSLAVSSDVLQDLSGVSTKYNGPSHQYLPSKIDHEEQLPLSIGGTSHQSPQSSDFQITRHHISVSSHRDSFSEHIFSDGTQRPFQSESGESFARVPAADNEPVVRPTLSRKSGLEIIFPPFTTTTPVSYKDKYDQDNHLVRNPPRKPQMSFTIKTAATLSENIQVPSPEFLPPLEDLKTHQDREELENLNTPSSTYHAHSHQHLPVTTETSPKSTSPSYYFGNYPNNRPWRPIKLEPSPPATNSSHLSLPQGYRYNTPPSRHPSPDSQTVNDNNYKELGMGVSSTAQEEQNITYHANYESKTEIHTQHGYVYGQTEKGSCNGSHSHTIKHLKSVPAAPSSYKHYRPAVMAGENNEELFGNSNESKDVGSSLSGLHPDRTSDIQTALESSNSTRAGNEEDHGNYNLRHKVSLVAGEYDHSETLSDPPAYKKDFRSPETDENLKPTEYLQSYEKITKPTNGARDLPLHLNAGSSMETASDLELHQKQPNNLEIRSHHHMKSNRLEMGTMESLNFHNFPHQYNTISQKPGLDSSLFFPQFQPSHSEQPLPSQESFENIPSFKVNPKSGQQDVIQHLGNSSKHPHPLGFEQSFDDYHDHSYNSTIPKEGPQKHQSNNQKAHLNLELQPPHVSKPESQLHALEGEQILSPNHPGAPNPNLLKIHSNDYGNPYAKPGSTSSSTPYQNASALNSPGRYTQPLGKSGSKQDIGEKYQQTHQSATKQPASTFSVFPGNLDALTLGQPNDLGLFPEEVKHPSEHKENLEEYEKGISFKHEASHKYNQEPFKTQHYLHSTPGHTGEHTISESSSYVPMERQKLHGLLNRGVPRNPSLSENYPPQRIRESQFLPGNLYRDFKNPGGNPISDSYSGASSPTLEDINSKYSQTMTSFYNPHKSHSYPLSSQKAVHPDLFDGRANSKSVQPLTHKEFYSPSTPMVLRGSTHDVMHPKLIRFPAFLTSAQQEDSQRQPQLIYGGPISDPRRRSFAT